MRMSRIRNRWVWEDEAQTRPLHLTGLLDRLRKAFNDYLPFPFHTVWPLRVAGLRADAVQDPTARRLWRSVSPDAGADFKQNLLPLSDRLEELGLPNLAEDARRFYAALCRGLRVVSCESVEKRFRHLAARRGFVARKVRSLDRWNLHEKRGWGIPDVVTGGYRGRPSNQQPLGLEEAFEWLRTVAPRR
jgi:hypothetical protein